MIEHRSFGVIPVRPAGLSWEFFLVQHHLGHWAFPKGHQEQGETGEQTARREFTEETGMKQLTLHTDFSLTEDYHWTSKSGPNHKVVTYFLGLVDDETSAIQQEELADGRWIGADEVEEVLTFPETQEIFRKAWQYLRKHQLWT